MGESDVEELLVALIMDDKIGGQIDQVATVMLKGGQMSFEGIEWKLELARIRCFFMSTLEAWTIRTTSRCNCGPSGISDKLLSCNVAFFWDVVYRPTVGLRCSLVKLSNCCAVVHYLCCSLVGQFCVRSANQSIAFLSAHPRQSGDFCNIPMDKIPQPFDQTKMTAECRRRHVCHIQPILFSLLRYIELQYVA